MQSGQTTPRLVLASRSPRRQSLLQQAGYQFVVEPANIDEDDYPPTTLPADVALHLAREKARTVSMKFPEDVVLGADTVVAFGDYIVGQPEDAADALRIIRLLSGTTHIVITGVTTRCIAQNIESSVRVMSAVRMKTLTQREIEAYIATGLWEGKAGAYGIQDDNPFVRTIAGCHTNVIGLPMNTTRKMLEHAGILPTKSAT